MVILLTLVDLALPILMLYWLFKNGSLSIVYVPFYYFAFSALEQSRILKIHQVILVLLLVYYVFYNLPFLKKNLFFIILVLMLTYGLFFLPDLKAFRMNIIGLYWALTVVALAPEIGKKYSKNKIFSELSKVGLYVLIFFIFNSFFSTIFRYYPENHYGFTTGVSFGNLDISEYSILPIATFLTFRKAIKENNLILMLVVVAGLALTLLTMRRMVMVFSLIGIFIVLIELFNYKQIKQLVFYMLILSLLGVTVVYATGFSDQLVERFQKRRLDDRAVAEEGRVLEFGLVYKDLFEYYDYDPWFGYGPLKSWGNYGKAVFGRRPLHSDITYYIHGFGFFGLFCFLSMVFLVFYNAYIRIKNREDLSMFVFALFYFVAFFLVGSPKSPLSPPLLFMTIAFLYGKSKSVKKENIELNSSIKQLVQ